MSDWTTLSVATAYASQTTKINDRDVDLVKGLDPAKVTVTNPFADMIRWSSAAKKWQIYSGTTWGDLADVYAINISGNAATASAVSWGGITSKPTTVSGYGITDAITTANIGSQSVASASVSTSAGSAASLSGTTTAAIASSALGTGSPDSTKVLLGDRSWGDRTSLNVPVRQTVLSGPVDANGYAACLTTGSGLRPGLDASPTPVVIAFAAGFGASGAADLVSVLSADVADFLGADLPANNVSYLYATYSSPTAVTWGATLNPPQHGYAFDRTRQSLLRFAGTDGSTTILDDYGNTWTAYGNAQIDTAVQIDGMNTLLLDGTGDYIATTDIKRFSYDSWQVEFKVRFNSLAAGNSLFHAYNPSGHGLYLLKNSGTGVLSLYGSENYGAGWDLFNPVNGTRTTWATGTTYHIALGYDAVAGKYYVSVDGVKDIEFATAYRITSFETFSMGAATGVGPFLNGAVAGFRFSPFCRYPAGATFTPPDISTFAVEGHFFSIPEMKMYEITSASVAAGTNPGMTARSRVFVGEAKTGAASVSSAVSYAYRGEYVGQPVAASVSTETTWNHNIGVEPDLVESRYLGRNPVAAGARNWMPAFAYDATGPFPYSLESSITDGVSSRIAVRTRTGTSGLLINGSTYSALPVQYKLTAKRSF